MRDAETILFHHYIHRVVVSHLTQCSDVMLYGISASFFRNPDLTGLDATIDR